MGDDISEESLTFLSTWLGESELSSCALNNRPPEALVAELLDVYDVPSTCARILHFAGDAARLSVALQFPDALLHHAPMICEALRLHAEGCARRTAPRARVAELFLYVLGDTSYGECCVDEVAAEHLCAELVVHYGRACLSPTRTLPVLYVFPRAAFASAAAARGNLQAAVADLLREDAVARVVVLYDVELQAHFRGGAFRVGGEEAVLAPPPAGKRVDFASLRLGARAAGVVTAGEAGAAAAAGGADGQVHVGALAYERGDVPGERTGFLWCTRGGAGDEWGAAARNAAVQLCTGPRGQCAMFRAVSLAGTLGAAGAGCAADAWRVLRKRLAVVERARAAQRFGIVAGTLGVAGHVAAIERVKRVARAAGRRAYVVLVGKPSAAKLGNFVDMDAFVLVACPQNALLDGREFLQPVVTPLELEAALTRDGDIFGAAYSLDFRELLGRELEGVGDGGDEEGGGDEGEAEGKAVARRGDWSVSVRGPGGAAEFLGKRLWQGLEYDTGGADGATEGGALAVKASVGQTGMASRYESEGGGGVAGER